MINFESDLATTVRTLPYGSPDALDDWYQAEQDWADQAEEMYVDPDEEEWESEGGMTDVEADADTLASCGWGTDEDYGLFGDDY
jgi:hypothetical protein